MKNKFSIIIPVYNVENYLDDCLSSVVNQSYDDYEVIIICDKCSDNSEKIVDTYVNKYANFKKIYAENTGLAKARNIGLKHIRGDYILFLDGDDFFNRNLLEILNNNLNGEDVIRFQVQEIYNDKVVKYNENEISTTTGLEAFNFIIKYHFIENAWCYCYKASFWKKNNFEYVENCLAEDYGLTPLIIAKAKTLKSISYIGYNYVQRANSLMNSTDYNKKTKKIEDMLLQSDLEKKELIAISNSDMIEMFLNNSLIYYITTLEKKDYRKYHKILKNRGCFKTLPQDNFKQIIKKFIVTNFTWYYYNKMVKK